MGKRLVLGYNVQIENRKVDVPSLPFHLGVEGMATRRLLDGKTLGSGL